MARVRPNEQDLWAHAQRQVDYIRRSAAVFDGGERDEAARLAVALRVLLHDTKQSASVLGQLGVKTQLQYYDTRLMPWLVIVFQTPDGQDHESDSSPNRIADLPFFPSSPADGWFAPLDEAHLQSCPRVPFKDWWQDDFIRFDPTILIGEEVDRLSRWDVVRAMAHQDGGAHVDPQGLDERYVALAERGGNYFWPVTLESGDTVELSFDGNAAACTVRQVCFELLSTLRDSDQTAERLEL